MAGANSGSLAVLTFITPAEVYLILKTIPFQLPLKISQSHQWFTQWHESGMADPPCMIPFAPIGLSSISLGSALSEQAVLK